jgi:hypothetical protein
MNMNPQLAKVLSYCFHPLLLPTWLFGLLFFRTPIFIEFTEKIRLYLWSLITLCTLAIPAVMVILLYKMQYIKSLEMREITERRVPMLLTSTIYVVLAVLVETGIFRGTIFSYIIICISFSVLIASVITLYYKISVHAVGIGGMVGLLLALQFLDFRYQLLYLVIGTTFAMGMILSARLSLAAHTPEEVWWGSAVGILGNFSLLLALVYWVGI